MSKHTPGKWQADECLDARGFVTIRPHDGARTGDIQEQPIATVYLIEDTKLIAAAPELLAALERVEAEIDGNTNLHKFVLEVIKKAKGTP